MILFKGSEIFSLDNKGRIGIPAKMYKSIPAEAENTFIVSRGLDQCINAYPRNIWIENVEPKYDFLDQHDPSHRIMLRQMLEWHKEIIIDGYQKILIPKEYLDFAKIESKVKIIGVADHLELWNPDIYDQYINSDPRSYEEIVRQVMTGSV